MLSATIRRVAVRTNRADDQRRAEQRFFSGLPFANPYSGHDSISRGDGQNILLQTQLAATLPHPPLELAGQSCAPTVDNARRPVAKHVLCRLDNFRIQDILEVNAQGKMADALKVGIEFRRAAARDALVQPLPVRLSRIPQESDCAGALPLLAE